MLCSFPKKGAVELFSLAKDLHWLTMFSRIFLRCIWYLLWKTLKISKKNRKIP